MQPIRQIRQAHCRQAQGRRVKSNKALIIIVLLVGLVGAFAAYQQYSIWADKQKFEKAQASIDALYADIVASVGEPDEVLRTQTCGHSARKYETGPLGCGDYLYFVYGVSNNEPATKLVQKVIYELKRQDSLEVTFSNEESNLPFISLDNSKPHQEVGLDFTNIKSKLQCSLRSTYDYNNSSNHSIATSNSGENLSFIVACQGDAKAEHYPTPEG